MGFIKSYCNLHVQILQWNFIAVRKVMKIVFEGYQINRSVLSVYKMILIQRKQQKMRKLSENQRLALLLIKIYNADKHNTPKHIGTRTNECTRISTRE